MFDKLQRRIILLNTMLIGIVVFLTFTCIFIYSSTTGISNQRNKLDIISNRPQGFVNPKFKYENPDNARKYELMSTDYSVSFSIIVGDNYSVINSFSFMDISEQTIRSTLNQVKASPKNYSVIKIDDEFWMYKIDSIKQDHLLEIFPDAEQIITMIKVTDSYHSIISLLIILIVAFICIVVASFFISFIFAKFTVKPIKESFEKQKNFIADASHELKTPLAIIKADASIVRDDSSIDTQERIKWLDKIDIEINKMTKLITSMLTLAQNEHIKSHDLETFSASDSLENILTSVEVILFEKSIDLQSDIQQNIVIKSSKESFEQIISILIDNAVKYTPKGDSIKVILKKNDTSIRVNIINTGVNISKSDLPQLFDRFYRADKSRNRSDGNFGLGLSIAKSLTQNLDGEISASIPNENSICFSVILPFNK